MGPLLVKALNEGVEPRLLLEHVRRGWFGGLLLERQMHPLMPPVLLGMARCDPLDVNPQTQLPHRQLAESVQRLGRRKREAIVGPDRAG
jgi:hypothetical protein